MGNSGVGNMRYRYQIRGITTEGLKKRAVNPLASPKGIKKESCKLKDANRSLILGGRQGGKCLGNLSHRTTGATHNEQLPGFAIDGAVST